MFNLNPFIFLILAVLLGALMVVCLLLNEKQFQKELACAAKQDPLSANGSIEKSEPALEKMSPASSLESPRELSAQEENKIAEKIDQEIQMSLQMGELKEKYEQLERIDRAKTAELEKTKHSLETELKGRREFNKIKDALEKDIKESRDQNRQLQVALANTSTEAQGYKHRINQLEDKVTKLEKRILQKEEEILNLNKEFIKSKTQSAQIIETKKVSEEPPAPQQPS